MKHMRQHRSRARGIRFVGLAGAILAVGGLSASAVAVGTASAKAGLVISTSKTASFGTILVSGTALYTLKASSTPCNAQCTKIWPEVLLPKGVKSAKAGAGVNAAKLGTVKRAHGALQVTYAGKPLYRFFQDTPGQVNGNITDAWGKWTVMATVPAAPSSTGSGSGGSTAGSGGAGF
jgi:predicted lipoprotein with Yx(FWY)xxD motif